MPHRPGSGPGDSRGPGSMWGSDLSNIRLSLVALLFATVLRQCAVYIQHRRANTYGLGICTIFFNLEWEASPGDNVTTTYRVYSALADGKGRHPCLRPGRHLTSL